MAMDPHEEAFGYLEQMLAGATRPQDKKKDVSGGSKFQLLMGGGGGGGMGGMMGKSTAGSPSFTAKELKQGYRKL